MFLYNPKHNFIHVDIPNGISVVSNNIRDFIGADDVKLIPNKYEREYEENRDEFLKWKEGKDTK